MLRSRLAKRAWLLLALLAAAFYLYGLGSLPLLGPDEPRYAQVAREMFERGDVVTPTLAGHTWFEKPALLYWLMMAAYAVCGVTEYAARLGPALAGLLTILAVSWVARSVEREGGAETSDLGLACGAALASSAGLMIFARGASFDILLTATVAAALACFFLADLAEVAGRRRRWLAGFYAGIGLALLAKGLAGVVIPGGVIATYFLLQRRRPEVRRLGLIWGPLLTAAVASLWYGPVIARHGWAFVDEFFLQHHFARYVSNKYHHPQPFYFYLLIAPLFVLPWTPFLFQSLGDVRGWRAPVARDRLRLFALAWTLFPIAFFSLSSSKLPGYILPALPGMAFLVGDRLAAFARGAGSARAMKWTGALMILCGAAGAVFAVRDNLLGAGCAVAVAAPVVAAGVYALLGGDQRRASRVVAVVVASWLTVALLLTCGVEEAARRVSFRDLLAQAAARGFESAPVINLHTVERTPEFYAAGRLVYDERGEPVKLESPAGVVDLARRTKGPVLVIIPLEYIEQVTENPALRADIIGDNGEVALVVATSPEAS